MKFLAFNFQGKRICIFCQVKMRYAGVLEFLLVSYSTHKFIMSFIGGPNVSMPYSVVTLK